MKYWILNMFLLFFLVAWAPKKRNNAYIGNAFDLNTNKGVYVESHEENIENATHTSTVTNYKDASGNLIASRKLNFVKNKLTPDYKLEDFRTGYLEGAEGKGDSTLLFYRKNAKDKTHSKKILIPKPYVIDGGFNYFIKDNWQALLNGSTLTFNIAIPSSLDYYKFRIQKTSEAQAGDKPTIVFTIELDNVVLRYLADPIVTTYNTSTKLLLTYQGLSNIRNESGKNYEVKIVYPDSGP